MAILIRETTEEQDKALEFLKEKYREKTNSKVVLKLLDNIIKEDRQLKEAVQRAINAERELKCYKETIAQIKWNIESGLPSEEDDSEFY